MKFPLLLFLYTLTVYANGAPSSSDVQLRIVGGSPAKVPYQVGLLSHFSEDLSVCGGSLLSLTSILTAATCFYNSKSGEYADNTTVVLGAERLNFDGISFVTSDIVLHPEWKPSNTRKHDVAMVHLPPNLLKLSDTIKTIRLPRGSELNESFAGVKAVVSGYGVTHGGEHINVNQTLNEVGVTIISNSDCGSLYGFLSEAHLCTSTQGIGSTCTGDAGSPLAVNIAGEPVVVGVVSFGRRYCDQVKPDVHTRVTSYISWINNNLTP